MDDDREQLDLVEVGQRMRDVLTATEGAVLWIAPPGGHPPGVLVRWDGGGRAFYTAEEIGSRLVRCIPSPTG